MNVVSFCPYVVEILESLDALDSLKACSTEKTLTELDPGVARFDASTTLSAAGLGDYSPDVVFVLDPSNEKQFSKLDSSSQELSEALGKKVKVYSYHPKTLQGVVEGIAGIGKAVGKEVRGQELAGKIEAEFKNWADNFYDRMKGKKVVVLSGVEPVTAAGLWIPDMVNLTSASTTDMIQSGGKSAQEVDWIQIRGYRPDVIFVTPEGLPLDEALKTFKILEKIPGWEDVPAVKRGEVFFTDGDIHFYRPTMKLRESMGILVSAMAGFDSGYITERDSFQRLRWLEMQRHKF